MRFIRLEELEQKVTGSANTSTLALYSGAHFYADLSRVSDILGQLQAYAATFNTDRMFYIIIGPHLFGWVTRADADDGCARAQRFVRLGSDKFECGKCHSTDVKHVREMNRDGAIELVVTHQDGTTCTYTVTAEAS